MLSVLNVREEDCKTLSDLISDSVNTSADKARMPATAANLKKRLFEEKIGKAMIVKFDGEPAGYCVYNYKLALPGGEKSISIEDIYIMPAHRGKGLGTCMLQTIGLIAGRENCAMVEWLYTGGDKNVLAFFERIGAKDSDINGHFCMHEIDLALLESRTSTCGLSK